MPKFNRKRLFLPLHIDPHQKDDSLSSDGPIHRGDPLKSGQLFSCLSKLQLCNLPAPSVSLTFPFRSRHAFRRPVVFWNGSVPPLLLSSLHYSALPI